MFFPGDERVPFILHFIVIFDTKHYLQAERTDEGKSAKECGISTISPNRNWISVAHTALVPYQHDTMDIGNLQTVLASKEKALTQSALRVLLHKREKLVILCLV